MLLLTLLQNEFINTTVLPEKKKGRYQLNHSFSDLAEDINIDGINGEWVISDSENCKIFCLNENDKEVRKNRISIRNDDVISLEIKGIRSILLVESIKDEKIKFVKLCFSNPQKKSFSIGKKSGNDIVLEDSRVSGEHAFIENVDVNWFVTDKKSSNGTYVNNRKIESGVQHKLETGDVIFIVGYKFIICADFISANIDFEKTVRSQILSKVVFPEFNSENLKKTEYPTDYFYRTIELEEKFPEFEKIKLLPPERSSQREEQSVLMSMGSAITMSMATVMVSAYSALAAYYRGTNMSYVIPSFIMSGAMISSSIMWPLIIRKSKKKKHNRDEAERKSQYQDYITALRDKVNVMLDDEKEYFCRKHLTTEECIARVIDKDRYLWSKSINDADFMKVSIGTGNIRSTISVEFNEDGDVFYKDDLRYDMMQFACDERILKDVPVTISLNNGCICGISGGKAESSELIRGIVIQLATLYSYDELKLVFILNEEDSEDWEYAKWLPHVWNSDGTFRYISTSADEAKELSAQLEKEIDNRTAYENEDYPKMLIIATDKKSMESIDVMPVIMKKSKKFNISILTSFGMYNYNNSDIIIEVDKDNSKLYDRLNNTVSEFRTYFANKSEEVSQFLDTISNIRLDITNEKYQLPKMITFLEMFKVSKVEHLNCHSRWIENNPIKSLKTEIGASPSGDMFYMDMHEKYHGPHGLIAGTTGSGKSESIITIILSLAVNYSPEEVAFVIVDYKGGGLADAFNDVKETVVDGKSVEISYKLPHVIGTVTNLDGSTIERARIAIETELKRRQLLFKKARKLSNEGTMDIYKYQQLRREGLDLEVIQHLFIVCDEFAELKDDQPEFMNLLISAARIGRSLGVHLILATQKPDGVIGPQIWSNSRFKICLKVQDRADSKAVIQRPDAAEISATGRFFFQVGYNEVFSMGQSAWCGADYIESDSFVKKETESAEIIGNTGNVLYEKIKKPKVADNNKKKNVSQLIAVRDYIIETAKDMDIKELWLKPIPAKLSLKALYSDGEVQRYRDKLVPLEPVIGKRDDLYNRVQEIMTLSFSKNGNLLVYGVAGSGQEMFFISLIYSLIYAYTPSQVNLYILDLDSGFLKCFEKAPQVGDIVLTEEEDNLRNVLESIKNEIIRRNKLFSEYRGEYSEYCKYSGKTLPNIVLILNNYTGLLEKNDDSLIANLTYIAREGIKRGVYIVIGTVSTNINLRLKQCIQQSFMFKMNDPTDYVSILGRTGGITPSDCVGSGIVKEKKITYKFQTADIFDIIPQDDSENEEIVYDASKEIKVLCQEALEMCGNVRALSYKPLEIDSEEILQEKISWTELPLGVSDKEVIKYNLSDKYITFISSLSEKRLSDFAGYLAKALGKCDNIDTVLLDSSGILKSDDMNYRYYSTIEDFEKWNREYKNEAESRCGKLVKNPDGSITMSEDAKHVFVIINSFDNTSRIEDKNVTFNNFKLIINELPEIHYHYIILDTPEKMNSTRGAYFHIVKNLSDIESFANFDKENNREWFDASGIWIGGGLAKSRFFEVENGETTVLEDEGIVIRNKHSEEKFRYFT